MALYPEYIPAQQHRVTEIILDLFARRDEFLAAIAPNGFENSDLVYFYRAVAYNMYDALKIFQKYGHKIIGTVPDSHMQFILDEIGRNSAPAIEPEMETTLLMGAITVSIFDYPHVVYDKQATCYRLGTYAGNGQSGAGRYLHGILYEHGILPERYTSTFNFDYFGEHGRTNFNSKLAYNPTFKGVDIRPACRFVFACLKEMDLLWDFGSYIHMFRDSGFFKRHTGYDEKEGTVPPGREMGGGAHDPGSGDGHEIPDEQWNTMWEIQYRVYDADELRYMAGMRQPHIKAYEDVYGELPLHYPPVQAGRDM